MSLAAVLVATLAIPFAVPVAAAPPTCDGRAATRIGTNGNDILNGTSGPDVIVGKGGNDTIDGRGGRDRICGGSGSDGLKGGSGNDRLFGGGLHDTLQGQGGKDDLFGFDGIDHLLGGPKDDLLKGGGEGDTLRGEAGDDRIFGEAGHDRLLGGDGSDGLDGGAGSDECDQGAGLGLEIDCERADLSVIVTGLAEADDGMPAQFTVMVTNHGPDAVAYDVAIANSSTNATCNGTDAGTYPQATLASGQTRDFTVTRTCQVIGDAGSVSVEARVFVHGTETEPADNVASAQTAITTD